MNHFRRSAISSVRRKWTGILKSENGLHSILEQKGFPSSATRKIAVEHFAKRLSTALKSDFARLASADSNLKTKDVFGANGICIPFRGRTRGYEANFRLPFQHMETNAANSITYFSARSFASKASKQTTETSSEKKDISTVEDPFDAPTYNIPEKPVTFAEGASYSVIILAGLGVAAAAAYAVFKELIFEPKEYKIFNKALKRIQDDSQVRVRIGSPITGYGQESRNRAARQRIPNRIYTDEFGIEHVEVNFYIRGPHGAGKVYTEMFKDKDDKQWKFTYLIVEISSPSKAQLMLESYMPAPASAPA
ncbi:Mitochondrial import inner membrane translocase subunit Tim21 [Melia azedarach]|uniref:Mitochondrial import inner membrane translocase subunit Tim21 n=1 Tax=Melia azedarach TaxID=155640 RepID=A0ACC1YU32_MELAZ|nr:Mitochondrial import inner membrane translocase subunit Tim21 [Melia azedarach]